MIIRTFQTADTVSTAGYSDCESYRYSLTRLWNRHEPKLLFVMLNPSTATEQANDPTVARCEKRARMSGFGALRVVNLFAFRATDPSAMKAQVNPIGAENDAALSDGAAWADQVICAWGNHGAYRERGPRVAQMLRATGRPLCHLGLTRTGQPRHPLYVRADTLPQPWP